LAILKTTSSWNEFLVALLYRLPDEKHEIMLRQLRWAHTIDWFNTMRPKVVSRQKRVNVVQSVSNRWSYSQLMAAAARLLVSFFLVAGSAPARSAATSGDQILLPIEVFGADGTVVSRTFTLLAEQSASPLSLWLQIHGLRYADQASVQVNASPWIPLNNHTVTIADPSRGFGGIGGAYSTLVMTLPAPVGTVAVGANTIRFRFNHTDGLSSGYRVLAWNFLDPEGRKLLPPDVFAEDPPEDWRPPWPDAASVQAGRELWHSASLAASSLPNSPRIQAHCADCHAQDGRDLKYFNFSNGSIVARSCFHGLSTLQGEQIASYIRSLPFPNPGRPWNPPYQPGPGLDEKPISSWAAGAGLAWVLDQDTDALPYLLGQHGALPVGSASDPSANAPDLRQLLNQITPEVFRPDGNLSPRSIPIALQLPDWSEWLPRIHPKDAWGPVFAQSEFAALYDGETGPEAKVKSGTRRSLRALLAALHTPDASLRPVVSAFSEWSQARSTFLRNAVKSKTEWSPELTNKVYSTQLWQLVKTWEMMQEFALEGRDRELIGLTADSRTWFNTTPKETAPSEVHIPDGPEGVGGSALTNEYFNASWYELQILLNSGNHQHRDRSPVDWVYLVGGFRNLYDETHKPEPTRLLVAVIKALQSTDPRLGPDDYSHGWRPEQNIDPRILVNAHWAPIFQPLPPELRRAFTNSFLAAWMDKNQEYPLAKFLPVQGGLQQSYTPGSGYKDITGGRVWEATQEFREAGVAPDLVERLQLWGIAYADRAARLQYH
jgi:hypothetical protein